MRRRCSAAFVPLAETCDPARRHELPRPLRVWVVDLDLHVLAGERDVDARGCIAVDERDPAVLQLDRLDLLGVHRLSQGLERVLERIRAHGQVVGTPDADLLVARQVADVDTPVARSGQLVRRLVFRPGPVERMLERHGELLELLDRTLEVCFRPGHSPSDTVFFDAERRLLIAADHLIAHISSNPLITRPRDGSEGRPQALVAYLESLRLTREMDVELVLPGHGDPITDHRALIDERFRLHRRRADKLHDLIAERPRSAHELAQALWGDIAVTQAYLTLSEVLGHTDILLNEGRVREVEDGRVVRFEALAGG